MDKILIKDILVRCIIGVKEDERREKQDVVINVAISTDLRRAGKSDDFRDTIDYRGVKKRIVSTVESSQFQLLEALAERIAEICLEHPAAAQARVTVEKPGALRFARSAGVEITRDRT
ncbi:MAG: dihydroneopterin aldolase [Armatimonadota bacterium]|nr:dihydroneopterin aldolase [Armatimonadota bacterium]